MISPSVPALEQAQTQFAGEGLPFPPIPSELAPRLQRLGPWTFGTRPDAPSLYDLAAYVAELELGPVADYVMAGHAGHGTNSWALHYYLVRGPLALLLQTAWGGIYTDNDAAARLMADRFAQAQALITGSAATQAAGRLALPARLAVVVSDFYGSRWAVLPAPGPAASAAWQPADDPLAEAGAWLSEAA